MRKLFMLLMLLPVLAMAAPTPPDRPLTINAAGNLKPNVPIIPSTTNLLVARDANSNISSNNVITGLGAVTTTGSTTELTMKSPRTTRFTGTAAQSVNLPATSTLAIGEQFVIINDSSAIITVQTSGSSPILALAPVTQAEFTARSTTSNLFTAWKYSYDAVIFASGKSLTIDNILRFIGTDNTQHTFPTTNSVVARTDAANNFLGVNKMENMAYSSPTPHGDAGSTETFSALKEAHTVTLNLDSTWTFVDFAPFGGNHIWISLRVLQKGGFTPTFPQATKQPQINPDADSITHFTAETWDGGTTFEVFSDYLGIVSPQQIQAVALPATNDNMSSALTITGLNAGETLVQWDAVYLSAAGTWLLGDANGSSTYPARGLATSAVNTATTVPVLIQGSVRHNAWAWTIGAPIYLSGTAGAITQTAPVIPGDKIQKVGWALTADSAYFDFSDTGMEIASGTPSPTPTATATATATPTIPPTATPTATATATPTATSTATATATATPDVLVNQNFEGTSNGGYDNGESWSPLGATNPDYTGVMLRGSQSMRVQHGWSRTSFSTQANVWAFYEFQIAAYPSSENIAGIIIDTGTVGVWVSMDSTGHVKINDNGGGSGPPVSSSSASSVALALNTHYYCWMNVVSGGTNTLYISTSPVRTGIADGVAGAIVKTVVNSNTSGGYNLVYLYQFNNAGTDITYDHVLVSVNSIGDNPP